jgi:tetratricopeptide (TPR) repeat protein
MDFRKFFSTLFGLDDDAPPPATEMQRWQGILLAGTKLRRKGQYDEALKVFEDVLTEVQQANNPVAEATVLGHIGALHTDQQRWDAAETALRQAVGIARSEQNPVLLGAVLNDWANYLQSRGETLDARKSFEEALTNARQGNDPNLTAHVLANLADMFMAEQNASYAHRLLEEANQLTHHQIPAYVGRLGEAAVEIGHEVEGHRWIVQALRLSHALGNYDQEILWANSLANRYTEDGKLHEAGRLYQRVAMLQGNKVNLPPGEHADYLLNRAEVSARLGKHQDAIRYAEEAIPLVEDLGRMDEVARAHGILGVAYRVVDKRDQALGHLQTALSYLPQDATPDQVIDLKLELARVQETLEPESAVETYQAVIEESREQEQAAQLGRALTYLGRMLHSQRQPDTALEYWREAVSIFEDQHDYRRLSPLLCDMANLMKEKGDRNQALTLYEQALVALNKVDYHPTRGLVLSNVANMYTDTGDIETAQSFYEESIKIARDTGDRAAESLRLGNLGRFYVVTGRARKASGVLEQALGISSQLQAALMEAVQRDNLALACARLNDFDRANQLHEEALALIAPLEDPRWLGVFHSDYGETLARQGQQDVTLEHYETALKHSRAVSDNVTTVRTLWRLGDLQRDYGRL